MKKTLMFLIVMVLGITFLASISLATPLTFYVSPGTSASGDLSFQTAALGMGSSNYLIEEDFEKNFINGQIVSGFSMGPVGLDISLPEVGDAGKIFAGSYGGAAGGVYGTVSGNALLNHYNNSASRSIRIDFSGALVQGFGLWVFDNAQSYVDKFKMTARASDGTTSSSEILDANPGQTAHIVEGFIGVTALAGLDYVIIEDVNQVMSFEVDHLQVVVNPVPEPATMLLLGTGLIGLAGFGRKKLFKK